MVLKFSNFIRIPYLISLGHIHCGSDPCQILQCGKKLYEGSPCPIDHPYYAMEGSKCDEEQGYHGEQYCYQGNCIKSNNVDLLLIIEFLFLLLLGGGWHV